MKKLNYTRKDIESIADCDFIAEDWLVLEAEINRLKAALTEPRIVETFELLADILKAKAKQIREVLK